MKRKSKKEMKLRPLDEVLGEIKQILLRDGVEGVLGFCITVKTKFSCLQLKWGDTRIRRFAKQQ